MFFEAHSYNLIISCTMKADLNLVKIQGALETIRQREMGAFYQIYPWVNNSEPFS